MAFIGRPERWFERDTEVMRKAFIPFSWGPRACIAKNLAKVELLQVVATIVRRYDIAPLHEKMEVSSSHCFSSLTRKELMVKISARVVEDPRGLYSQNEELHCWYQATLVIIGEMMGHALCIVEGFYMHCME